MFGLLLQLSTCISVCCYEIYLFCVSLTRKNDEIGGIWFVLASFYSWRGIFFMCFESWLRRKHDWFACFCWVCLSFGLTFVEFFVAKLCTFQYICARWVRILNKIFDRSAEGPFKLIGDLAIAPSDHAGRLACSTKTVRPKAIQRRSQCSSTCMERQTRCPKRPDEGPRAGWPALGTVLGLFWPSFFVLRASRPALALSWDWFGPHLLGLALLDIIGPIIWVCRLFLPYICGNE